MKIKLWKWEIEVRIETKKGEKLCNVCGDSEEWCPAQQIAS